MKISTRFYLMMSGIILSTIILLTFTVISINNIRSISAENQNKNIPIMIHSLQLKNGSDTNTAMVNGYFCYKSGARS